MTAIRPDALGFSVFVLLYSSFCEAISIVLVCMLWRYGERTSYVSLICMFVTLSTTASIIQQIHYAVGWEYVKNIEYQQARELGDQPPAEGYTVLGPRAQQIPFYIQWYSYNVLSLLILFWTVSLFRATWNLPFEWHSLRGEKIFFASTVFAFVFPLVIIITVNTEPILKIPLLYLILNYMIIIFSLSVGSTLLVLILFKYIRTQRVTARHMRRSGWWQPGSEHSQQPSSLESGSNMESSNASSGRSSRYDRALITRFSIAFILLALFEIFMVTFQITQKDSNGTLAGLPGPDYSLRRTQVDITGFIPGVTASLVAFAVFGTTKSFGQYKRMLLCVPKKRPDRYSRRNSRRRFLRRTESQQRVIASPMILSPNTASLTNISPLPSPRDWAQHGTELSGIPPPLPSKYVTQPSKTDSWPLSNVTIQLVPPAGRRSEETTKSLARTHP